jgi:hypothetical protein
MKNRVADRWLSRKAYTRQVVDQFGVQTFTNEDNQKAIPTRNRSEFDYQKRELGPSAPDNRQQVLPIKPEFSKHRTITVPYPGQQPASPVVNAPGGSGSAPDGKSLSIDKVRTKGIPGEDYGHPSNDSGTMVGPRRKDHRTSEEVEEIEGDEILARVRTNYVPTSEQRQKVQKGKQKKIDNRWYKKNRTKAKIRAKIYWMRNKAKQWYKTLRQKYRDNPLRFKRKPAGGESSQKDRSRKVREELKNTGKSTLTDRKSPSHKVNPTREISGDPPGPKPSNKPDQPAKNPVGRPPNPKKPEPLKNPVGRPPKNNIILENKKNPVGRPPKNNKPSGLGKRSASDVEVPEFFFYYSKLDSVGRFFSVDVDADEILFDVPSGAEFSISVEDFLSGGEIIFLNEEDIDRAFSYLDYAYGVDVDKPFLDLQFDPEVDQIEGQLEETSPERVAEVFLRDQKKPSRLQQNLERIRDNGKGTPGAEDDHIPDFDGLQSWVTPMTAPPGLTKERDKQTPAMSTPAPNVMFSPGPGSRVIPRGMGYVNNSDRQTFASVVSRYLKTATRIEEIESATGPEVHGKSQGLPIKLRRVDRRNGLWLFDVTGKTGTYRVRVKPLRKGNLSRVSKADVKLSCSCPFWRWQGPEHWAKTNGYLYGRPRGTASTPDVKDPSSKHWACKHVLAVIRRAKDWDIPKKRKSSEEVLPRYLSNSIAMGRVVIGYSEYEDVLESVVNRHLRKI